MDKFIQFFSLSEPNVRFVVLGSLLLTSSSAVVGCFAFLRKRSLAGDAIAHSVLPGVCLSFLLAGNKNPILLLIGAFVTGWLSLYIVELITGKSKIKEDTAIGIVLSVFFGIGILMLTAIQHSGNVNQAGLDSFLFGKAASIVGEDLYVFGSVAGILILTVIVFFKEFTLISFDINFSRSIGLPVKLIELILSTLTVMAVVVGIQAVGVVLMAAMLITPAASARFWTNNLTLMIFIAAVLGGFSGVMGAYISYLSPAMPTGPWIVAVISLIAMFTFMFAPQKGIIAKLRRYKSIKDKITGENILKALFQMGEKEKTYYSPRPLKDILEWRQMPAGELESGLKKLKSEGYLNYKNKMWELTKEGLAEGQRITRLHRLWEMYLTEYLKIAPDHVHEDAEGIEHIITPEIEAKLKEQLGYPDKDPHQMEIPYKN